MLREKSVHCKFYKKTRFRFMPEQKRSAMYLITPNQHLACNGPDPFLQVSH